MRGSLKARFSPCNPALSTKTSNPPAQDQCLRPNHQHIYTVFEMSAVVDEPGAPFLVAMADELCLAVIEELVLSSIIAISQTSRQCRRLADPTGESRRFMMSKFIIEAQAFPRWQIDGFICFACTSPSSQQICRQTY